MSSRDEDILLDVILDGIANHPKVANPTVIAEVTYAPETDRTTCWIRLGGEAHECAILMTNIRVRKGNKIKVRRDGNGRYEMVGTVSADDAVSGVFPPPSTDSPFPPVVPPSGPVLDENGDPVEAGTEILDRRPDNEYGEGGAVEEPQGGRKDPPTPPAGGGGYGPIFPIDLPNTSLNWGTDEQMQGVIGGDDSFVGDIPRLPHVNHQHGHGQHPLTEWTTPAEPHYGYAYRIHAHPELGGDGGAPVSETIPVPTNDTTKHFATQFDFQPQSLVVFLNGLRQVPWRNAATPEDMWEYQEDQVEEPQGFIFHDDVVVDGTTVAQEVPDVVEVLYWRPAATAPVDPETPPPDPPSVCFTNFTLTRNQPQGVEFTFDTSTPLRGHAMWGNPGGWVTDFTIHEADLKTHHHMGWGFPASTASGWTMRLKIWLTDANNRIVCEDIIQIIVGETPEGPVDSTPPVISNLRLTALAATTATIAWDTDESADGVVQYGLTTGYGSEMTASSYLLAQSVNLTGLTASTVYHYRVRARDTAGNVVWSADQTFTTPAPGTTGGDGWGEGPWGEMPWGGE